MVAEELDVLALVAMPPTDTGRSRRGGGAEEEPGSGDEAGDQCRLPRLVCSVPYLNLQVPGFIHRSIDACLCVGLGQAGAAFHNLRQIGTIAFGELSIPDRCGEDATSFRPQCRVVSRGSVAFPTGGAPWVFGAGRRLGQVDRVVRR